ncbi:GlcNAc-PI de-N-acetylase [Desertihabitans brevis]|uniref:GlcNAc-PI de-N-acetylase n=2 Tax=Desertihabitans brevis TaxID=2268447 RepID=A0A367YQE8_9ACTN|nr:GlcNAc-PI de-N-acetylase [Desertihabitans brevis]
MTSSLLVHAHPDDETLATGALIAELVGRGRDVAVLTATRGEQGEIVPGTVDAAEGSPELSRAREAELAGALAALGVRRSAFLGQPPARVPGRSARGYRDSGMRWVSPGVAGPAESADDRSFTSAGLEEVVDDLCAYVEVVRPTVLVSYDAGGTYGHPDHVRCHHVTREAARRTGLAMVEVLVHGEADDAEWWDLSAHRATVVEALRHHASQLTVLPGEQEVRHVGGQTEPVALRVGLRLVG